jgi:hypothetical protein
MQSIQKPITQKTKNMNNNDPIKNRGEPSVDIKLAGTLLKVFLIDTVKGCV